MEKLSIQVAAASGVEAIVKNEIFKLGYRDGVAINGRIETEGDFNAVARLNMFLRAAERVYIKLNSFVAEDFDTLFTQVRSIEWQEYLTSDAKIVVNAKSVKSKLFSLSTIQSITKKAIVDKLFTYYNVSRLTERGVAYDIEVSIHDDNVVVCLDTSGVGLFKRGYRDLAVEAPIKETLAAAMIYLSRYRGANTPFADLFCGSGTIPIEAAMMQCDIATGLNRSFDFSKWNSDWDKAYGLAVIEAKDRVKIDTSLDITGYDIDSNAISISQRHAKRAGVDQVVKFVRQDVKDFKSDKSNGIIVSNPPYGERLMSDEDLFKMYCDFGKAYKGLDNWSCFVLTSSDIFTRAFNAKFDKNRKLYNANLECYLYQYYAKKPMELKK